MLKVIGATLKYPRYVREFFLHFSDQLRRRKQSIILQSYQWFGITILCFFLIYGTATLALYTITSYIASSAHSDFQADYGEWTVMTIPRVDSKIIEEIQKDNPNNPNVYINPEEIDPYKVPFITIQNPSGNEEPPIGNSPLPSPVPSEPTNTQSPNRSPASTPTVVNTDTFSPTPSPSQINPPAPPTSTQAPTNLPAPPTPTLQPTNSSPPPTPTLQPTNSSPPPTPTLQPTNSPPPPTPTLQPTNSPPPPTPTLQPTNTPAPPTSTSPPTPTNQP
ncbi:MAG: hypothetical protein ACXACH_03655, partial [Candidatus Hermodarchaeia archaeon]